MTSQELAKEAAAAADDKKAQNIVILDVQELTPVADCFVICSANSGTQVEAISKSIRDKMEQSGIACRAIEGLAEARWVLMDFGDVVVHVFRREEREFYNLERLWGDAVEVPYSAS